MKPYALLVNHVVYEFVERLPRRDMLAVRRRFIQIRDFPGNYSDYNEVDESGVTLEVHVLGKLAIKYWIDDADRHVKVLDIHPADRKT